MFTERTSVGLDVHARSVAAAAIDSITGEVFQTRLTPSYEHIRSWIADLPGPAAVTYEAGPTGFGLYRALTAAQVRCEVAAPSKLQKPSGDRVKTDARDALHLARLLRLDEITSVSIPTVDQEAARDLVRAREDCRGDLMRARHRLSKLLLRHGIVYYGGVAWTGAHDRWLRTEAAPQLISPATRMAFDADYEHVLTMQARRRRLDTAIEEMAAASEFTPIVNRMCCLRGVSTLTGFGLAVEIGDWNRFTGNSIGSFVGVGALGAFLRFVTRAGIDHQDRQHPRPSTVGGSCLASPAALSRRGGDAVAVGPGAGGGQGPGRRGQSSSARALGGVSRTPQTTRDRECGDRAGACGVVLVVSGHERLIAP